MLVGIMLVGRLGIPLTGSYSLEGATVSYHLAASHNLNKGIVA